MNFDELTQKELETLDLLAKGKNIDEIMKIQCTERTTVVTHLRNIYQKAGINQSRKKPMKSGAKIKLVLAYLVWIGKLKNWEF